MTRYEKYSTLEGLAGLLYDTDATIANGMCRESPVRVNGECPYDIEELDRDKCIVCMKAWLEREADD